MDDRPLILASGSTVRQKMLRVAGLDFAVKPAAIDEKAVQDDPVYAAHPGEIAAVLARSKALHVAQQNPGATVIGADQVLVCGGRLYTKAGDLDEARANILSLKGRTHQLIAAVCVARDGEVLWEYTDEADLTVKDFDDAFLAAYMRDAGDALLHTVGGYEVETPLGAGLFAHTDGDYFTILGMPLIPLLGFLLRDRLGV